MRACGTVLLLLGALAPPDLWAQSEPESPSWCNSRHQEFANAASGPLELWDVVREAGIRSDYEPDVCTLNPWYITGDFDADGEYDFMVLMRQKDSPEETRLAVLWGSGKVEWIDRAANLRYPPVDAWRLVARSKMFEDVGIGDGPAPSLQGDAVMISALEAGGALLYWDGNRFTSWWAAD